MLRVCCAVCVGVCGVQSKADGREGDACHRLIHTPPWEHESTPIERVWSVAKGFAARVHTAARKPDQLRVDLLRGFYGSAEHKHDGVTAERMGNFIRSADACVTEWIRSNPLLRAAYPPGTPAEGMGIRTFSAAERRRYRDQNKFVVTFDDVTDSSDSSSDESDDNAGSGGARQRPAAAAAAAAS